MRRSTQTNFNTLLKDEVVKRFESVVVDEIKRNDIAISHYQQEYEVIHNLFTDQQRELSSIKELNRESSEDMQKLYSEEIKRMEISFDEQRRCIREGVRRVDFLLEEIKGKVDSLVSQGEYKKDKQKANESLLNMKMEHHEAFDRMQISIEKNSQEQKKTLLSYEEKNEMRLESFRECLEDFHKTLSTNVVDSQGISRMMKVDQKTMFIMEKKIENLYTLINRMKE